ncbi:MAG: aspartate kinase [Terriglobales bacterium]
MALIVMKFGGTSVANAECVRRAASLVRERAREDKVIVVVSALAGVTDAIVSALQAARSGDLEEIDVICNRLRTRHRAMVSELIAPDERAQVNTAIDRAFARVGEVCGGVAQLHTFSPQIGDMVLSLGEEMSAAIFAAHLRSIGQGAESVDAAQIIVTDAKFGDATPDLDATSRNAPPLLDPMLDRGVVPVVTGYRGATSTGQMTTLGRGGSDYSATILGAAVKADEVWIWTDVDGVLTADPRVCPAAAVLPEITFNEAVELSHYGAKVIHERAVRPVREANIPVWIKNSMRPEVVGTKISASSSTNGRSSVKAVTAVSRATLITLTALGDAHSFEIFGRLFLALAGERIHLLLALHSSQDSLGLLLRESDEAHVMGIIQRRFRTELKHGVLSPVSVEKNVAAIAVIGEAMKGKPGILARIFRAVAERNVSVIAAAQGASELNICLAVPAEAANMVVEAVHDEFALGGGARPFAPPAGPIACAMEVS